MRTVSAGSKGPALGSAADGEARDAVERAPRGRRVPYRVPCKVRLFDPESGADRTVVGQTVNLSDGGVAMQVAVRPRLGTWVETLVPNLTGEPRTIRGWVVHTRKTLHAQYEVGVRCESGVTT